MKRGCGMERNWWRGGMKINENETMIEADGEKSKEKQS